MTEAKRDELMLNIWKKLGEIEVILKDDHLKLNGNGQPGLLERINNITTRVQCLEYNEKSRSKHTGVIAGVVGFLVNAAIALYAAIRHID